MDRIVHVRAHERKGHMVRAHDRIIHNSRPTSAEKIAERLGLGKSVVTGPRNAGSVVSGPYTGKRAAFTKDMSTTGREAQSIATKIRMQSSLPPAVQQPSFAHDATDEVGGKWLSKQGRERLKEQGVEVDVREGVTHITRNGQTLARIFHPKKEQPGSKFDTFTDVHKVDEHGPRDTTVILSGSQSHDEAVERVLRRHDIPVRGLPSADLHAMRTRSAAKHETTSPEELKSIYGDRLHLHEEEKDPDGWIATHVEQLGQIPAVHHEIVAQHMHGAAMGGIHLSSQHINKTKGSFSQMTAEAVPGHAPDENTAGMYYELLRQVNVGGFTALGGQSVAAHEFGHALDHAYGKKLSGRDVWASSLPDFQQVYGEVTHKHDNSKTVMNPYFTHLSGGDGAAEMWGQSYAAWTRARHRYRTPDEQAQYIGHALDVAPSERLRVGRVLVRYFDRNDQKMRSLS